MVCRDGKHTALSQTSAGGRGNQNLQTSCGKEWNKEH